MNNRIEEKIREFLGKNNQCQICGSRASTEIHHLFSQTKRNIKNYKELIHDKKNLMAICGYCRDKSDAIHISEKEFCDRLGINIISKSGLNKGLWKMIYY